LKSLSGQFFLRQEKKLQQLIQALSGRANLFCTSSEKLWVKLSRNGKYNIKMISFPYSTSAKKCLKSKYDLVFLGDNRFEKSLYLLADYLVNNTQTKALLQVTPAKGYPEAFRLALEKDLETLQTNKRVEVMFGGLAKEVLEEAICSSRVVVLPYHPLSYKRRTSALMALAILFEKPVISSHGTWAGDIVEEKLLGTTFIFEKNRKKNLENFTKAVRQIEDNYEGYQSNVRKCRLDWEKEYSYQTFLKKAKVVND
jgi:glycosyltransferase involved in cell wall biosynthesis